MALEKLDEKGFVFIDDNSRPYWCRMWGDEPWFMYWNDGQKSWVTLRRANQTDIWMANEKKIPDEQAQIYHDLHEKFIGAVGNF
jgi:hypothetical protein